MALFVVMTIIVSLLSMLIGRLYITLLGKTLQFTTKMRGWIQMGIWLSFLYFLYLMMFFLGKFRSNEILNSPLRYLVMVPLFLGLGYLAFNYKKLKGLYISKKN